MDDPEGRYANLQEYIRSIDVENKVSNQAYEERLGCCKKCDLLVDGMCRACGCFVEMRAAMKEKSCPYEKWTAK